jgi:hypothetical protein
MSKINTKWHLTNKIPKNLSLGRRVKWQVEHAGDCQCHLLGEMKI